MKRRSFKACKFAYKSFIDDDTVQVETCYRNYVAPSIRVVIQVLDVNKIKKTSSIDDTVQHVSTNY